MSRARCVYITEEAANIVTSFDSSNPDETDSDGEYLLLEFVQQVS